MWHRFNENAVTNAENSRLVMKNDYYSFSFPNRLQRWRLFIKTHILWRLQFLNYTVFKKPEKKNILYKKSFANEKPLVYSCSGCSSAAQMANYLAVQLDRKGLAEMSCIVGVGGNVKKLVRTASSGRKIIVIDGCPLACSKACLGNHSLKPDMHFELTGMGVKKLKQEDFDMHQANKILMQIKQNIGEREQVSYKTFINFN